MSNIPNAPYAAGGKDEAPKEHTPWNFELPSFQADGTLTLPSDRAVNTVNGDSLLPRLTVVTGRIYRCLGQFCTH
ncbi:MAG: hypothetical protein WCO60_16115 [Verrucomicrobiota bacterium]